MISFDQWSTLEDWEHILLKVKIIYYPQNLVKYLISAVFIREDRTWQWRWCDIDENNKEWIATGLARKMLDEGALKCWMTQDDPQIPSRFQKYTDFSATPNLPLKN